MNMLRASLLAHRSISITVDDHIIALMRLVLAASALVIIAIDPSQPDRYIAETYTLLSLYTLYSAVLYLGARYHSPWLASSSAWEHWADIAWYTVLIGLSSGTNSIFFLAFFFPVLVASFRYGFGMGLRVVVVSALAFTVVGYLTAPPELDFQLNEFLLRPTYLFVLGYMIAYWGGYELILKHRLAFLKEVGSLSNPRLGIDRSIGGIVERLRAFYHADTCLLVMAEPITGGYHLRRADRRYPEQALQTESISADLAGQLLDLPPTAAVLYCSRPPSRWRWRSRTRFEMVRVPEIERMVDGQKAGLAASAAIAAMLDAESFVSVPLRYRQQSPGRLYLARQRGTFGASDAEFLLQVLEQVMPVLDNIRLVDRLASTAAEEERQRVTRDLHDSVIQPYVGLHMGLVAIHDRLRAGDSRGLADLERLIAHSDEEIAFLRGYVRELKGGSRLEASLPMALQRFIGRFSDATGIAIQLQVPNELGIGDRLAAEVLQLVAEGLSNIRRHTHAARALVTLGQQNGCIVVRLENEGAGEPSSAQFTPRSITDRAAALGGRAWVEPRPDGGSRVVVEIPL